VIQNWNRYFSKVYIIVYAQADLSCGNEGILNVLSEDEPDAVLLS
jgi:hypothetical protein